MFKRKSKLEEIREFRKEILSLIEVSLNQLGYYFNSNNYLSNNEDYIKDNLLDALNFFFKNLSGNTIYSKEIDNIESIIHKKDPFINYYNEYYQYHKELENGSILINYCKSEDDTTEYYNEIIPVGQWIIKWVKKKGIVKIFTDKEIKRLKQIKEIMEK